MPRTLGWRDLRIGIVATLTIVALTAAILFFARLGRLPGDTYRLHVRAEEARGIIVGSEVWLNGQKVGAVRGIRFLPPSLGTGARVLLETEMLERHRSAVRRDSRVQIRSGGSLIGAPVVYLTIGSPASAIVRPDDTLRAEPQSDLESVASRYASATQELPGILNDVKALGTLVQSPDGTLGAFFEERGGTEAAEFRARAAAVAGDLRSGRGTVGRALAERSALMARARLAMARADSIQQLLGSPHTSLGRFRRDSTLALSIADIRNELTIVRALLAEPRGTLGRFAQDSAIFRSIESIESEMAALFADVKRRPFRYLSF